MKRIISLVSPFVLITGLACGDDGPGGSGDTDGVAGAIEFRGEQPLLPGFDYDSGWLPDGSPVAIRATASASGGITVLTQATTDGVTIVPVAGSGSLRVEGSLAFELSARIDTAGIEYEGVVDSFAYGIEPVEQTFDPFALDAPVTVTATLEPAVLGEVPIPSVPGATLVLEVEGGELTTAFAGTCAEAREGFAQYAGALTTSGTVRCAATVEIELPLLGTESFGPFAFDVVIPALTTAVDLGTRSLGTGEPATAMAICGVDAGDDGTTGANATADDSGGDGASPTSSTTGDATSSEGTDTSGGETSGGSAGDPDYPSPGACARDDVAVSVDDGSDNGVCLPPCAADGACPSGATGDATGLCAFNPLSSFEACTTSEDCTPGEFCADGFCFQQTETHCILVCEGDATCPDGMECRSSMCTYPL